MPLSVSSPLALLTGGAGYIGSHTALALLEAGWRVLIVDDLSTGTLARVPPAAEFIEADCADPLIERLIPDRKVDVAIHFAARIKVNDSVRDPIGYYEANSLKALEFFKLAARSGLRGLVFSSTAAVYGSASSGPVTEDCPVAPESPYGRSKLMSEWMLSDIAAASTLRHVTLRYFNVAGADPLGRSGPSPDAEHLIKLACDAACVRDFIHVCDLASAHVAAARHLLEGGDSLTLNCGYGRGYSVRQVVERTLALTDRPFPVREGPRRAGDPPSQGFCAQGWAGCRDSMISIRSSPPGSPMRGARWRVPDACQPAGLGHHSGLERSHHLGRDPGERLRADRARHRDSRDR